jgi:hypothetical protein
MNEASRLGIRELCAGRGGSFLMAEEPEARSVFPPAPPGYQLPAFRFALARQAICKRKPVARLNH